MISLATLYFRIWILEILERINVCENDIVVFLISVFFHSN